VVNLDGTVPQTEYVDERGLATWLGLAPKTLRAWRCKRLGPRFLKLGPARAAPVRYRVADVQAWIAARVIDTD